MAHARCKNGHIYDTDIYGSSCPYCSSGRTSINFGGVRPTQSSFGMDDVGKSVPVSTITAETISKTTATQDYVKNQEEFGKTQAAFKVHGADPVVGWLVCVTGPNTGRDYRLFARINTIGRAEKNDVCLKGDNTISSQNHAKIAYAARKNDFYLLPGDSTNTIYLNDEPVYEKEKLRAYDRIILGNDTEVLFVPFCGEQFSWPADGKGE